MCTLCILMYIVNAVVIEQIKTRATVPIASAFWRPRQGVPPDRRRLKIEVVCQAQFARKIKTRKPGNTEQAECEGSSCLFSIVRLRLLAFLLLLGLLLVQRIMWAWRGARPNNGKRADDTQRSKRSTESTPKATGKHSQRAPWWEGLRCPQEASWADATCTTHRYNACITLIKWRRWLLKSSRLQNGERKGFERCSISGQMRP